MCLNIKNNVNFIQQRGFSLIELLIAIPLSLLVMLVVLKIFTANIQGVNLQNAYSRVLENGRMSVELMTLDIRISDYWGCVNDINSITSHLKTTDSDYDSAIIPINQQAVTGVNNVSALTISTISVINNTDTLTLWGSTGLSNIKVETPYMTTSSAAVHISTGSGIEKGDILLITDCIRADLFTNTSNNTDTSGTIGHNTGTVTGTGNVDNETTNFSDTYDGSAQILIPYVKTYFIGQNSAGSSSLYRSYNGTASEMVRGITDLQLTYGEDLNGNGSVDTFVDASSVINMDNIVSINLQLISESGTGASSLQRTYTVTANIRNRTLQ